MARKHTERRERRRHSLRAFLYTFFLTLCVLLAGVGFLAADYNTRQTGFGDFSLSVGIQTDRPLDSGETPAEPGWTDRVWQLLPAKLRAAVWLIEGEIASAVHLLTALLS
ncbi:MAG: hypothetical protein HFJ80_05225 [Clostridiales bacterium]|nr:hypothetical protein [Clostridiales bacterium]